MEKFPATWTSKFLDDLMKYETVLYADACSSSECFRFIAFLDGEAIRHCTIANALEGWLEVFIMKPTVANRITSTFPSFFAPDSKKPKFFGAGICDPMKQDGRILTKRIYGEVRIVRLDAQGNLLPRVLGGK